MSKQPTTRTRTRRITTALAIRAGPRPRRIGGRGHHLHDAVPPERPRGHLLDPDDAHHERPDLQAREVPEWRPVRRDHQLFGDCVDARRERARSTVDCKLVVGATDRVIASAVQTGSQPVGLNGAYPAESMSIVGLMNVNGGEALKVKCTTTGASDSILSNGSVVVSGSSAPPSGWRRRPDTIRSGQRRRASPGASVAVNALVGGATRTCVSTGTDKRRTAV